MAEVLVVRMPLQCAACEAVGVELSCLPKDGSPVMIECLGCHSTVKYGDVAELREVSMERLEEIGFAAAVGEVPMVIAVLIVHMEPAEVNAWMVRQREELDDLSPRQWLELGRGADRVLALARDAVGA